MPAEAVVPDVSIAVLQEQLAASRRDVNGYAVLLEQNRKELDDARSTIAALDARVQALVLEIETALNRMVVAEDAVASWKKGVEDANRISQRFGDEAAEARRDATRARLDTATARAAAQDLQGLLRAARAQLRVVEAQRDAMAAEREDLMEQLEALLPAQAQPVVLDMVGGNPTTVVIPLVPDPALDLGDEGDAPLMHHPV